MVEIADIMDRGSLRAWLDETSQSRKMCIALAHRAAMREIPLALDYLGTSPRENVFSIWWALLVSGSASGSTQDLLAAPGVYVKLKRAADTASFNSADIICGADLEGVLRSAAKDQIVYAAARAAYAVYAGPKRGETDVKSNRDAASDAVAFASSRTGSWHEVRADCQHLENSRDLFSLSLWHRSSKWMDNRWAGQRQSMLGRGWQFWVKWYERALAGKPQPWRLLLEIATQEDSFWRGADDEVMVRINDIVARYEVEENDKADDKKRAEVAKANSPNAEFVRVVDGRFVTESIVEIDQNFYEQAIERAVDAMIEMREVRFDSNLKGLFDSELDRLTEYLGRLSDKPLRIYEELMRIVLTVDEKIKYNGLDDWRVNDFRTKLDNSALDILTHDAQVRRAVRARAVARFDRMTAQEQEHYKTLMDYLAVHSEPSLAGEMRADAAIATDPNAPEEDQHEARYQSGSRATRMTELRDEVVENAEAAAKIAKSGKTIAELGREIMAWFL